METKNSEHKEGRSYDMLVPPELLERKKKEKKEKKRESGTNDWRETFGIDWQWILSVKDERGIRRFANRIWIPNMIDLERDISSEAHESRYSIHPGSIKMY